jgi:hypothetical protein
MRKRKRKTKKAWGIRRLPPYLVRVADPVAQGHHGRVQASPSTADTCCGHAGACSFVPSRMGGVCSRIHVERD